MRRAITLVLPASVMRRAAMLVLLTLVGMLAALLPRAAWAAGCGVQDLGACVDDAQYTFWFGLTALGWSLNRTLLLLAYQLDTLRWWLVEVAFTSAYQVLTQLVDPLIVPFATVAIIVGCLALLLLPVFGRVEVVKIRHALAWVVIAPVLLTLSGPLIVQTEQVRAEVGTALFTGVSAIAPGAIFGATGADMAPVVPLYPSNPCGGTLARQGVSAGPRMDDLAAALLWADAEDIHCPDRGGPSADVPDRFYVAVPDGPGYAMGQAVGEMYNAVERAAAVDAMQRGAIRTALGLLPSALAVLDALVQLLFALCLVALWIGLPIGLLFVSFAQTADPVTGLFRRGIGVLQVSWSSSVVLGMLFACLLAAAELRNAAAYTGFAIGALILTSYILLVAVDTLKSCLRTLSDTVAVATGLNPAAATAQAGAVATGVAGLGLAAATGGAGLALAGAVAAKQTGSGRYAAGAMLGQFAPVARVGEIAAAMGESGEVVSGVVAGGRSQRSGVRALAAIAGADNRRTDSAGLSFRDHATERQIARTVTRRPTVVEELGAAVGGLNSAGQALRAGTLTTAVLDRGRQVGDGFQDRLGRVGDSWQRFGAEVEERSGGAADPVRIAAAGVSTLDRRITHRGQAMRLDPATRKVTWSPHVAPADLPEQVITERREQVRVPRLLTLGYTVQEQDDGTLSFWPPLAEASPAGATAAKRAQGQQARPPAASPQVAAAERRIALVEAGALVGNLAALRTELAQLRATAAATPPVAAPASAGASNPSPAPANSASPPSSAPASPADPPAAADQSERPPS
jgi:hypothetical protein